MHAPGSPRLVWNLHLVGIFPRSPGLMLGSPLLTPAHRGPSEYGRALQTNQIHFMAGGRQHPTSSASPFAPNAPNLPHPDFVGCPQLHPSNFNDLLVTSSSASKRGFTNPCSRGFPRGSTCTPLIYSLTVTALDPPFPPITEVTPVL